MIDYSLRSNYFTEPGCSSFISDKSQDGVLEGLSLVVPLGYTGLLMLHYYEGIELVFTDGELISCLPVFYYCFVLDINWGNDLGCSDGSFDASNIVNHIDHMMVL